MRLPDLPGYRYEGLLGEDPFGWTFVASHESGKRRTIRIYKSQATSDRLLYPYFKALSDPNCPFAGIARIHDFILQDPKGLTACATPFYGWKGAEDKDWQVSSLQRLMGMLTRAQIHEVVLDLATTLGQVHGADLFHGGVRPSAIFLTGDAKGGQKVHLSEFGQIFMGGLQYLEAGELLFYAAPEQLASGDFNEGRGKAWDVYAFGVVAFQLLTGHLPRLDRLRQHNEENPAWLESTAAITFGELSEVTEYFLQQLEAEQTVEWPGAAADSREAALRAIVARCLKFAGADRPASMMEVADEVGEVFSAPVDEPRVSPSAPVVEKVADKAKAKPAPREKPKKKEFAPVLETAAFFEESAAFDPASGRGVSLAQYFETLRENAVLRWQFAAIGSLLLTLTLTCIVFFVYLKERKEKNDVETKAADLDKQLKSNVEKQALAYVRMTDLNKKTSKLTAELNESEDSKNSLLGQATLTRQLLRETQDSGDRFFRLVLENRDTDVPEFRSGRAGALEEGRKHYERLVETYGDAPDFIVSTANALFYLGQVYKEMGEFGKSLATFGEAERRYSALLENESTAKVEFVKNIAVSKSALGDLSIRSGQYSAARHYYTESSRFWTEARSREPVFAPVAALHIHENSLSIVECELAMDRPDAAIDAAMSVGVRLTEMQKEDPENPRIIGAIAKSFTLVGRVLEARRENELAEQAYQQSGDLYAKAVQLDAAVDEYHLGLGNSLARVGLLADDTDKLEAAAEILGRVAAANPFETTYLTTLAEIYGVLAVGQRNGGKIKNAIALEEKAIVVLRPIVEGNKSVAPDVKYSLSQRLTHLAELLGDSGKFDESRVPLKEAIALLEGISGEEGALAEYHRTLARTLGMAGFHCIKSGNPGEAKEHLRLAKTEWQSYMAANPNDNDAAQAVKWTAEQLESLQ